MCVRQLVTLPRFPKKKNSSCVDCPVCSEDVCEVWRKKSSFLRLSMRFERMAELYGKRMQLLQYRSLYMFLCTRTVIKVL